MLTLQIHSQELYNELISRHNGIQSSYFVFINENTNEEFFRIDSYKIQPPPPITIQPPSNVDDNLDPNQLFNQLSDQIDSQIVAIEDTIEGLSMPVDTNYQDNDDSLDGVDSDDELPDFDQTVDEQTLQELNINKSLSETPQNFKKSQIQQSRSTDDFNSLEKPPKLNSLQKEAEKSQSAPVTLSLIHI